MLAFSQNYLKDVVLHFKKARSFRATGEEPFLGAFAKFRKATVSFMSVRLRGTTRFPVDGF